MPKSAADTHPSSELIRRFGGGELRGGEADAIEQHVETCARCCQILRELPADPLLQRLAQELSLREQRSLDDGAAAATRPTPSLPDVPWSIALQVTAGPHAGKFFTFAQHDTFLVGRAPQAHFCLPAKDPAFSRLHFLIEVSPPLCRLVDLNSHNGTLVNGQKVSSIDLHDGDEIRGGTTLMRVQIRVPEKEIVPAPAPAPKAPLQPSAARKIQASFPAIPGYRILGALGRGSMGVVYRARRESDQSEVALKTIIPKIRLRKGALDRFLREANIPSQWQHPHIVAFLDMGQTEQILFFAMPLVVGTDANKLVKTQGPLPIGRAIGLVREVLDALAYAHQKGFVHRDLKPANILIAQEQGQEVAKVADFGLARAYQESPLSGLIMSGNVAGTPQYMPPEQVLNFRAVKPAADQYAAAASLYFLLTAKPHYEPTATMSDFYERILNEDPVRIDKRRRDLPKALANTIHRALARDPEKRFADVLALRKALTPYS
jgi:eukaryotic-like serine/threonine-protein kinase